MNKISVFAKWRKKDKYDNRINKFHEMDILKEDNRLHSKE